MKKLTGALCLIGGGEAAADIRYATGFSAPGAMVYVRVGSRAWLAVSPLEYGRALREARGVEVLLGAKLVPARAQGAGPAAWAAALLRRQRCRAVLVPASFPIGWARKLEQAGLRVQAVEGAIFPERAVKRAGELTRLRAAQYAAVSAMRAARACIASASISADGRLRNGRRWLRAGDVRACIERCLLEHDGIAEKTIVACGRQAADPHAVGDGMLRAGVPIVIDIFPRNRRHGYYGDLTRTYIRGAPRGDWVRVLRAVLAAQRAALAAVAPGVPCRAVHAAAETAFRERGFETRLDKTPPEGFLHAVGHGIGLEVHEEPRLSAGSKDRLRAGHVVTIEPGLYYPGVGGVRIEDTIVVTSGGWRLLQACPKRLCDLVIPG